jgi:hypothetical protein
MKRSSLLVLLGSLCAMSALATTYVRVEKDGTKTYSDRPIPGGQPIDLQPAQTYSTPQGGSSGVSSNSGLPREQQLLQQVDDFKYTGCPVTPANDFTFQSPETVTIAVTTTPALRPGDIVTLTVDGQPVGGSNAVSYTLSPVYRGTHTVGVTIKDVNGQVLCNSASAFHVIRPGLNSPARR